ncbi:molybdenum cofactor biosynthesis protein MoaE [Desulfatiferula olefinivorans]
MNLNALKERVTRLPDYPRVGMILCHNGVVRETSRDGRPVSGLSIRIDRDRLASVIEEAKRRPGIVEVLVELADEDRFLAVGEDVMCLVVAGDVRERVIACLAETLDAVKATVTSKTEYYKDGDHD